MMPDGTMQMMPIDGFEPCETNHRAYRDALGRFASGVTVVTARTGDGWVGMTANSFASVSLEPPLVLWCPAKNSARYPLFAAAQHFAIHVLSADQKDVALAFARSGTAFDGLSVKENVAGVPVFSECLARFECETAALHDAGDHGIMVGHVRSAAYRHGAPLIFSQGDFRGFDNEA